MGYRVECSGFRAWESRGLGFRARRFPWFLMFGMGLGILSPIMENQMEKTMEHESTISVFRVWGSGESNGKKWNMELFFLAFVGFRLSQN